MILITGGAGFIGSHLTRRLVSEGNQVVVIDNLITTESTKYIDDLIQTEKILFIKEDISELSGSIAREYLNYYEVGSIDEIYNLASPASIKLYTKYPLLTFNTSTVGVQNMLEIARNFGSENVKFLETSTSEVYGDPLVHPQPESYNGNVNTQNERSCYDESKRSAEVLCYLYNKLYGVNTHIARLFNVYGPNNTDDRVIPTFIQQSMKGEDITIYGDGKQTRSFCYVDDVVEALIKLQRSNYNKPVNIGNPHEVSINELASIINTRFGFRSNIVYKDLPEGDPVQRCPDIRLAKSLLNWEPTTSLDEGLNKTIKWLASCK